MHVEGWSRKQQQALLGAYQLEVLTEHGSSRAAWGHRVPSELPSILLSLLFKGHQKKNSWAVQEMLHGVRGAECVT